MTAVLIPGRFFLFADRVDSVPERILRISVGCGGGREWGRVEKEARREYQFKKGTIVKRNHFTSNGRRESVNMGWSR